MPPVSPHCARTQRESIMYIYPPRSTKKARFRALRHNTSELVSRNGHRLQKGSVLALSRRRQTESERNEPSFVYGRCVQCVDNDVDRVIVHRLRCFLAELRYHSRNPHLIVGVPEWTQGLGKPAKSCRSRVRSEIRIGQTQKYLSDVMSDSGGILQACRTSCQHAHEPRPSESHKGQTFVGRPRPTTKV